MFSDIATYYFDIGDIESLSGEDYRGLLVAMYLANEKALKHGKLVILSYRVRKRAGVIQEKHMALIRRGAYYAESTRCLYMPAYVLPSRLYSSKDLIRAVWEMYEKPEEQKGEKQLCLEM